MTETTTTAITQNDFNKYDDELNEIIKEFHRAIFKVIEIAEKVDPKNYYVSWVKQQVHLFRKIDKENIIKRVKDKIWHYREEVMNHDLNFFYANQYSQYIKEDENKQFMYSFINMLKKKIKDLSEEEKEIIWGLLEKVLETCIRYKKLVGDYEH